MKTISLTCCHCQKVFQKYIGEYNRQLREKGANAKFYCSFNCNGQSRVKAAVKKICKCGNEFETRTDSNHCSTRCASFFSMTPSRLAAITSASSGTRFQSKVVTEANASALRSREWSKYTSVDSYLLCHEYNYQFEYLLPGTNFIYDLVIFDKKLLIEFDEIYHKNNVAADEIKTAAAKQQGWKLYRIDVSNNTIPYNYELTFPALYGY